MSDELICKDPLIIPFATSMQGTFLRLFLPCLPNAKKRNRSLCVRLHVRLSFFFVIIDLLGVLLPRPFVAKKSFREITLNYAKLR